MAGVSGRGKIVAGKPSKSVHPATGNSAGLKNADGNTGSIGAKAAGLFPTKKQAAPNGNTPMHPATGQNAHSNIAKGPGKPGKSKR